MKELIALDILKELFEFYESKKISPKYNVDSTYFKAGYKAHVDYEINLIQEAIAELEALQARIKELERKDCKICFNYGNSAICETCKHYWTREYEEDKTQ